MLLVIALLLCLLFFGLGFVLDVLWWGIVIGLILAIAAWVLDATGRRPIRRRRV